MAQDPTDSDPQARPDRTNPDARRSAAHGGEPHGDTKAPSPDDAEGRPQLEDHEDSKVPGVSDKPTHSGYEEKQGDAHGNTRRGS